jgi:hypothetical protein
MTHSQQDSHQLLRPSNSNENSSLACIISNVESVLDYDLKEARRFIHEHYLTATNYDDDNVSDLQSIDWELQHLTTYEDDLRVELMMADHDFYKESAQDNVVSKSMRTKEQAVGSCWGESVSIYIQLDSSDKEERRVEEGRAVGSVERISCQEQQSFSMGFSDAADSATTIPQDLGERTEESQRVPEFVKVSAPKIVSKMKENSLLLQPSLNEEPLLVSVDDSNSSSDVPALFHSENLVATPHWPSVLLSNAHYNCKPRELADGVTINSKDLFGNMTAVGQALRVFDQRERCIMFSMDEEIDKLATEMTRLKLEDAH